ncbi:hypothetical protein [Amnibacterium endophyticum]|uniref:Peptide synthetase n=1 Tax=Amnibacterium endophyticum TaxID=2109337 RepID=A0ABW4LDV4_9MICO
MAYRDVLFEPLVSVFLVAGLDEATLDALPAAARTVVRARTAARRRWPGPVLRPRFSPAARAESAVPRNVRDLPAGLSDPDLIAAAHAAGLHGLPFALTRSGDRCVVATAHAVYDGTASLELVHDLLDAAAGLPLAPEPVAARAPVRAALRRVRLADVRRFVDARRHRDPGAAPAEGATIVPRTSTAAFALDRADLVAIRRYREPDRAGRPTLLSRIAGLIVTALREVQVGDGDVPVWMTTDLRHLVDGRVDGNFIGREQIGTLHGDQWAPGALAARLVAMKGPGQALSLVWSTTGWLLRSALGRRPVAGEEVVLTLAATQRAFPVPVRAALATSIGGSPTFGFAWQTKDAVHVSVHSTSGRFDLDRFEDAFRRIVRERAGQDS